MRVRGAACKWTGVDDAKGAHTEFLTGGNSGNRGKDGGSKYCSVARSSFPRLSPVQSFCLRVLCISGEFKLLISFAEEDSAEAGGAGEDAFAGGFVFDGGVGWDAADRDL